jgi:hypothetical protein
MTKLTRQHPAFSIVTLSKFGKGQAQKCLNYSQVRTLDTALTYHFIRDVHKKVDMLVQS